MLSAPIPYKMQEWIAESMMRWGKLSLETASKNTIRLVGPETTLTELKQDKGLEKLLTRVTRHGIVFPLIHRAELKRNSPLRVFAVTFW